MPLAMEGPRPLSPLERDAFRLVFWDSIDSWDISLAVVNVGPVDRFRNIDMRIHNSGKGTSRIVKYQHARESIHNYFGWLLVELRHGWKAVCQGKESFTKNKRQAWVPTWA